MAIYEGPFASGMRGKLGNVVGAKTVGGRTALRAYKEHVKNPNTLRQQVSRAKMQKASGLAALFAEAIGIGYAKAVQGMKMYPRNLFVSDVIPVDAGIMTNSGTTISVDYSKLPISKAAGIAIDPVIVEGTPETGEALRLEVSNIADYTLQEGESLGLVVALYDETLNKVIVKKGAAADGIGFTTAELGSFNPSNAYGFVKVIPNGINGVPSSNWPWKYPSATSKTIRAI